MKNWIIAILLLCTSLSLVAQTDIEPPAEEQVFRPWYLSIVPQFAFVKGLRFDVERRIDNSISAIVVSPRIYLGEVGANSFLNNGDDIFTLSGFGAELGHKLYLDKEPIKAGTWYIGYNLIFNSVNLDYANQDWVPFTGADGNTYSRLEDVDQVLKINQFGGSVVIGALLRVDDRVYIDLNWGIGAKSADINDSSSNDANEESFTRGVYNFGYTGTYTTGVIKIGIQF